MNKIQYVSVFFRILLQCIFACLIATQVLGWVYAPLPGKLFNVIPTIYQYFIFSPFTPRVKWLGFFITLPSILLEALVLYFLIKLFRLYEKHEIFSANNVRCIRNAGYALLVSQLVRPVAEFALGFVITAHNPPGLRLASMTFSDTNLETILIALVIILISWIMAEGHKLNEEQQFTV